MIYLINLEAPIVPWKGMGGIKLYSHINEFYSIIEQYGKQPKLLGKYLIRYEIDNSLDLWFNLLNGKLFKITATSNYNGTLFNKIRVGMHIDEVLKIEPSFEYDDFEEVYCSSKGIFIETDPVEHTVLWISVYVKELDNEDFERGNW
ncbi:hypothetical protein [Shouchella clausii]|uniref:hypothetical protein n=1 Tax=Shouchella clausii TaxID=79880 RepID=UPI00211DAA9E|nr:hypothetical protein [Shouchella clausii]